MIPTEPQNCLNVTMHVISIVPSETSFDLLLFVHAHNHRQVLKDQSVALTILLESHFLCSQWTTIHMWVQDLMQLAWRFLHVVFRVK